MKDQLKDENQITSKIRQKIEESIEPAFKSIEATQTAYKYVLENIAANLKQLDATQTAYVSALENVTPTLKQLEATTTMLANISAQNPLDKINIQRSIEAIIKNLQEAAHIIRKNERLKEDFRTKTNEYYDTMTESKKLEKEHIHELEKLVENIKKILE
jgi:hypothetical protein